MSVVIQAGIRANKIAIRIHLFTVAGAALALSNILNSIHQIPVYSLALSH